jgi:protein-disulfide isomerase
VEICKVSPVSPAVQIHAPKHLENAGDKTASGDMISPKEKVSPENNVLNCVQNNSSGDTYDIGDTLHIPVIADPAAKINTTNTESFSCNYCETFPLISQEYEKHVS